MKRAKVVTQISRNAWVYALLVAISGLTLWSYGFNNVPLIRPLPLVDALVFFAVTFSFRRWWALRRAPIVSRSLFLLTALSMVVLLRLVVDIPRFGLLAVRDALFAFEFWVLLPAMSVGFLWGEERLNRYWAWLFALSTVWFLLYPWRDFLAAISPVFGIQRPVPLFAFTTAGFISVPAFFWFLHRRERLATLGVMAALLIILMVQSRGAYLAFLTSIVVFIFWRGKIPKGWVKLLLVGAVVGGILGLAGHALTGRLSVPVGLSTVVVQLKTLAGMEGPGAGSVHHRLRAWRWVVGRLLSQPLAPIFGVGLGPDLFQGFNVGSGVLVRKPHNDFLEIWARLGVLGLLPWLGILITLGWEALKGVRRKMQYGWVLALQIMLWITSLSQPAMAFAYITVVWAGLTGLWMGTQLRQRTLFKKA